MSADAMSTIVSATQATLEGSIVARITHGTTAVVHHALDETARETNRTVLREVGYQHVGVPGFPGALLSDSQVDCVITPTTDDRLALILPAISKAAVSYAAATDSATGASVGLGRFSQIPSVADLGDCAPFADGYCLCRLTVAIKHKDASAPGFRNHPYEPGVLVPPPLVRTFAHPSPRCGLNGCLECQQNFGTSSLGVLAREIVRSGTTGIDEMDAYDAVERAQAGACRVATRKVLECCRGFTSFLTKPKCVKKCMLAASFVNYLGVCDVAIPAALHQKISSLAHAQVISNKRIPAHFYTRITHMVEEHNKDLGVPVLVHEWMLAACRLLFLCLTAHALLPYGTMYRLIDARGKIAVQDEPAAAVESAAEEARAKILERHGDFTLALPLRPASEFTGFRPGAGLRFIPDEDAFAQYLATDAAIGAGAVVTGPNLFGKNFPINTKDLTTMMSAVTRHFYAVDVELDAGADRYNFQLCKDGPPKDLPVLRRVAREVMRVVCDATATAIVSGVVSAGFDVDNRPASMTEEEYLAALDDAETNNIGREATAKFCGSLFSKSGEDGDRARFISVPGRAGTEKMHQARTCGPIKMLETVFKHYFNHTHVKGLDETAKREAFASFLGRATKKHVGLSFDKKANDRTWTSVHWDIMLEQYAMFCHDYGWHEWQATHVYTADELTMPVQLRMQHAFGTFVFESFSLYLLSGIGPTGFFNRFMSLCEEGVIVKTIYGDAAYGAWIRNLSHPTADSKAYWRGNWMYGTRFVHDVENLKAVCINEGDDKTGLFHLIRTTPQKNAENGKMEDVSEEMTVDELIGEIVRCAAEHCGVAYEIARMPQQDENWGRKSALEFCSAVITIPKKGDMPASLVPKPIKALGKLAWSATRAVNFVEDDDGVVAGVVEDSKYFQFCATKMFSLASCNRDSPFVGRLFLQAGRYYLSKVRSPATVYAERAPERRKLDEWKETTFTSLFEMSENVEAMFPAEYSVMQCYAAAVAWKMEFPAMKDELAAVIYSLRELDLQVMGFEFDDDTIRDDTHLYRALEWYVLKPHVCKLAAKKFGKMAQEASQPFVIPAAAVDAIRAELCGGDSKTTFCGKAKKESDNPSKATDKPNPKPDAPPHGKTGKGKGAPDQGKSDGKASGKSDGKANGKGKGKKGGKQDAAAGRGRGDAKGKGKGKSKGDGESQGTHREASARSGRR